MFADIQIFGGIGVAGLALACMLSDSGHRVRVLEKLSLAQSGSGIRVPPNLSKILLPWFGARKMAQMTIQCEGIPLHHCQYD